MRSHWPVALAAVTALLGCSQQQKTTGSALLRVGVNGNALSAADVARVHLTVTDASGLTKLLEHDLVLSSGLWGGVIPGIPAGSARIFKADAYDAGSSTAAPAIIFSGVSKPIDVPVDGTVFVSITAQQVNAPPEIHDVAPVITSMVASARVLSPGATLQLQATVYDGNPGDVAVYAWTAVDPNGTAVADSTTQGFSAPSALDTLWIAPASPLGTYTLTLTVTDQQGAATSESFAPAVSVGTSPGDIALGVSFNSSPVVTALTTSPTQIDVGATTTLTLAAHDPDLDPLTFYWTPVAPCTGYFDGNGAGSSINQSPTFTLTGNGDNSAPCKLSVVVADDHNAQGTSSIGIQTGPLPVVAVSPTILSASQSAVTALGAGDQLTFTLLGHAPFEPVAVTWTASSGSVLATSCGGAALSCSSGAPGDATFSLTWGSPGCAAGGSDTAIITATLTDSTAMPVSKTFKVLNCPVSCSELHATAPWLGDGVYAVDAADPNGPVNVYCDMTSNGGGWQLVGKVGDSAPQLTDYSADFTSNPDGLAADLSDPSFPAAGSTLDAHLGLHRFDAYSDAWTLRAIVDASADYASPGGPLQSTFWRPTPGSGISPGVGGTNWQGSLIGGATLDTKMLWLATSTGASGPANGTWAAVPANNVLDGAADVPLFVFAFEFDNLLTVPCIGSGGQSQLCNEVGGGIVNLTAQINTGTYTSSASDADGVAHAFGKRATYWLRNSNAGGAP